MVGILIDDDFDKVADAIRPLMDDKTLVVVSSDFTHYGEGYGYVPFKKDIEKISGHWTMVHLIKSSLKILTA